MDVTEVMRFCWSWSQVLWVGKRGRKMCVKSEARPCPCGVAGEEPGSDRAASTQKSANLGCSEQCILHGLVSICFCAATPSRAPSALSATARLQCVPVCTRAPRSTLGQKRVPLSLLSPPLAFSPTSKGSTPSNMLSRTVLQSSTRSLRVSAAASRAFASTWSSVPAGPPDPILGALETGVC